MIFHDTELDGCYLIESEPIRDERGSFARIFDKHEFEERGLDERVAQTSVSYNEKAGTLRGLHYQEAPYDETKLVRCIRGRIYDVAVDIRPDSPMYLKWMAVELEARHGSALYVPKGFAHGFVTLEPNVEILYQISAPYRLEAARGIRWNDPAIGVSWPEVDDLVLSPRDAGWPDFAPALPSRRE